MGQHRLIVVDMDYGSQSETLVNCDMWNTDHDVEVKKMPVATHGLLWLFSSSFNISSWEGVSNRGPTWPPAASTTAIRDRGISVTTWVRDITEILLQQTTVVLARGDVPMETDNPFWRGVGGVEVVREVARVVVAR